MKKIHDKNIFNLSDQDKFLWEQAVSLVKPIKNRKTFNLDKEIKLLQEDVIVDSHNHCHLNDYEYFEKKQLQKFNKNTIKHIKNSLLKIEKRIDLHGLNIKNAEDKLIDFIITSYENNLKLILIITGKGKNSKLNRSVLRELVIDKFENSFINKYIISYTDALIQHGGEGALYVLLKKNKKNI